MDKLLSRITQSLSAGQSLEDLARPMLQMLESATGMESTYLTLVDVENGFQHILYARNTRQLQIPEGQSVPWSDSLCKRALEEGCSYSDEVPEVWGDSIAAKELGIQTYASTPVHTDGGKLYGTLCAVSTAQRPLPENALDLMQLFSKLISQQVQREQLVAKLEKANAELAAYASTDVLTGLPNRRALLETLDRMLAQAIRTKTRVLVCFLDLDGFKRINDMYGHDVGDAFLAAMSQRISGALRGGDYLARLGGDEFVLVGYGPALTEDSQAAVLAFKQRVTESTIGPITVGSHVIDYAGASAGVVAVDPTLIKAADAVQLADTAMYEVKRTRQKTMARHGLKT
jgi:diguanylate cyclase